MSAKSGHGCDERPLQHRVDDAGEDDDEAGPAQRQAFGDDGYPANQHFAAAAASRSSSCFTNIRIDVCTFRRDVKIAPFSVRLPYEAYAVLLC